MKRLLAVIAGLGCGLAAAAEPPPRPLVTGLKNPQAVAVGFDGRVYVTEAGEIGKDGDGRLVVIEGGKAVPFTTGLDDPRGVVAFNEWLFVADKKRVWRVDRKGKATEFAAEKAFPAPPASLAGIAVDEQGTLYVADAGDGKAGGAIFRVDVKGKVSLVADAKKNPALKSPAGLAMDGMSFLLVADASSGELHRLKLADGTSVKVAEGLGSADGLAWDRYGRLYVSDGRGGKVHVIPRPGEAPVPLADGLGRATGLGLDPTWKLLLVPDAQGGAVTAVAARVPKQEVDESPLPLETAIAFPDLKWEGWEAETPTGKLTPLRPVLLTHAGDGSNRVFVATEQGVIHVFPNDQKATKTRVFLDLRDRVKYDDKENEEGFLGLAFHPKYRTNGEFFVFYTTRKAKLTNVVSRFRVSKNDPDKADPDSEEVLLRFEKPFWNHDGGTLCFGPDGYLYLTHGDGGAANDPFKNGQNLKTLLGKVLRIDVDHKDEGKNYAVPKDNPFVGRPDAAGEIWAYGLRNLWRMSFDRKTGVLWAGDVGQNLYEEIDLIVKGGNYGWNLREGLHPFGPGGADVRQGLIEPIWEYDHVVGKCIVGGHVYRGPRLPELDGHYLYADYVTNRIWALRYDEQKGRVVANRSIKSPNVAILSFGEDEKGEVYFLRETATGKGIYWFVRPKEEKR
jgi:glucose/arabinose dehydrogenase/sugar lactone lactonase YvrE